MLALLLAITAPWWDDFPTTAQTPDPALVRRLGATSAMAGLADDPTWGIYGARLREFSVGDSARELAGEGVALLAYIEGFGTATEYVVALGREPDGSVVSFEPGTARPLANHWCWGILPTVGPHEVRWVGLPSWYDAEEWLGPWTRLHPRYGAPPFRYPDGREATGYLGDHERPDQRALYDAGCSKDLLGRLWTEWGAMPPGEFPGDGLVEADGRLSGHLSVGKDPACPGWVDYARAQGRFLGDSGVRGVWCDNMSLWDSLGSSPLTNGFGEWSVAGFRDSLQALGEEGWRSLGLHDEDGLDVRAYLRRRLREMGGDDTDLRDPRWSDPSWLDDRVWLRYILWKRDAARDALVAMHDALVEGAREAGIEDFGVQGNDIPLWSFGAPSAASVEMVSTEFSPGWNLLSGSRGLGLAPRGRLAPVIRTARTHGAGRFVHLWYYLDGDYEHLRGDADFARRLGRELLANHAAVQAHADPRVAGTPETHREIEDLLRQLRPVWRDRVPYARIALLYSPLSQLAELTPGGVPRFDAQPHTFDLLGWGTALAELGIQYEVVREERLVQDLGRFDAFVLPTVSALSSEAVAEAIAPWVEGGGRLIVSGPCGTRLGAEGHLAPSDAGARSLAALTGGVLRCEAHGLAYYLDEARADPAASFAGALDLLKPLGIVSGVPREAEVTVFRSPSTGRLHVDIANLGDGAPTLALTLTLPGHAEGTLAARAFVEGEPRRSIAVRATDGGLALETLTVPRYASIAIDGWRLATR